MKKMLIGTIALLGIVILTGCPSPAGDSGETTPPESWTHMKTISVKDESSGGYNFTTAVALDGGYAIIGNELDKGGGDYSGAAHIFHRESADNWTKTDKIRASDFYKGDHFAQSVDISGSHAIIGAYKADSDSGAAYVFSRNDQGVWEEEAILNAPNAKAYIFFGLSVAIDGDFAVVGALLGGAFIFERKSDENWHRVKTLTPFGGASGDDFGRSVAISGNSVVVGSPGSSGREAAYVFVRDRFGQWSNEIKLTTNADDKFGHSTAIQGRTVIVGSPLDDDNGLNCGAVYEYYHDDEGDWVQKAKLLPPTSDASQDDLFGSSLDYDGKHLIVGAYGRNAAYIYSRGPDGKWRLEKILSAPDTAFFGASVAISGDVALVGSEGKAYIYY